MIGSRICGGNTAYKRNESDFYPTPPDATFALLNFLEKNCFVGYKPHIWECAAGEGDMARAMITKGYPVTASDIRNGDDFLSMDVPVGIEWIITNPPFSLAEDFIRRCAEIRKPFALLLKSQYWHAKRRNELFREAPPSHVLPLLWRPDFCFGKRGGGSPLMDVCWNVWDLENFDTRYIPLKRPIMEMDNG